MLFLNIENVDILLYFIVYLSSFLTGHPDERCAGDDEPRPVDAAVQIVHDGGALQVECADGRISSL